LNSDSKIPDDHIAMTSTGKTPNWARGRPWKNNESPKLN